MQITSVKLKNFRSHTDSSLNLGPRTLLVGPNGSGKSSILDAIAYGLTGICRGTDAAGRGAGELISHFWKGSDASGGIEVRVGGQTFTRAIGQGPKVDIGIDSVFPEVKRWGRMLEAAVRPDWFSGLPPGEQAALFASFVATDDLGEVCRRYLKDAVPDDHMPTTLGMVDRLEAMAREIRPKLKREIGDLEKKSVVAGIPDHLLDASDTALADIVAKASEEIRALDIRIDAESVAAPAKGSVDDQLRRDLEELRKDATRKCPACDVPLYRAGDGLYTREQRDAGIARLEKMMKPAKPAPANARRADLVDERAVISQRKSEADRVLYLRGVETKNKAQIDALKERLARAESIVKVLAPKGELRTELAQRKAPGAPDLLGTAQGILDVGRWGNLTLQRDPWRLALDEVPAHLLSHSQRLRVNLAMQIAIVHAAGLRFVTMDNVESLDADQRGALGEVINAAGNLLDQVILAVAKTGQETVDAAIPTGWTVVQVWADDDRGVLKSHVRNL